MFGKTEPAGWLHYADSSYVATRLLWFTNLTIDSAVYGHRTLSPKRFQEPLSTSGSMQLTAKGLTGLRQAIPRRVIQTEKQNSASCADQSNHS
jgi:hypothetical protein